MGTLKDIVDLTKELESRAKDRRDMETVHKIQSLIFTLQSTHTDIVERDVQLMQENVSLKKQLSEAQAEDIRIQEGIEFRKGKRTGGKWSAFCPKCHCPAQPREKIGYVECTDVDCRWFSAVEGKDLASVILGL